MGGAVHHRDTSASDVCYEAGDINFTISVHALYMMLCSLGEWRTQIKQKQFACSRFSSAVLLFAEPDLKSQG